MNNEEKVINAIEELKAFRDKRTEYNKFDFRPMTDLLADLPGKTLLVKCSSLPDKMLKITLKNPGLDEELYRGVNVGSWPVSREIINARFLGSCDSQEPWILEVVRKFLDHWDKLNNFAVNREAALQENLEKKIKQLGCDSVIYQGYAYKADGSILKYDTTYIDKL